MKKHDEGYVLVYVTVVLLVFCLVATTILTGAHNNLQNQQRTNEKMKQQYLAAGEIEKVMARWSDYIAQYEKNASIGDTGAVWHENETDEEDNTLYVFSASSGDVMITCKVYANGTYYSYEIGTVSAGAEEVQQ